MYLAHLIIKHIECNVICILCICLSVCRETYASQWTCVLCEPQEQDDSVGGPQTVHGGSDAPPHGLGAEIHS